MPRGNDRTCCLSWLLIYASPFSANIPCKSLTNPSNRFLDFRRSHNLLHIQRKRTERVACLSGSSTPQPSPLFHDILYSLVLLFHHIPCIVAFRFRRTQ